MPSSPVLRSGTGTTSAWHAIRQARCSSTPVDTRFSRMRHPRRGRGHYRKRPQFRGRTAAQRAPGFTPHRILDRHHRRAVGNRRAGDLDGALHPLLVATGARRRAQADLVARASGSGARRGFSIFGREHISGAETRARSDLGLMSRSHSGSSSCWQCRCCSTSSTGVGACDPNLRTLPDGLPKPPSMRRLTPWRMYRWGRDYGAWRSRFGITSVERR